MKLPGARVASAWPRRTASKQTSNGPEQSSDREEEIDGHGMAVCHQ